MKFLLTIKLTLTSSTLNISNFVDKNYVSHL